MDEQQAFDKALGFWTVVTVVVGAPIACWFVLTGHILWAVIVVVAAVFALWMARQDVPEED